MPFTTKREYGLLCDRSALGLGPAPTPARHRDEQPETHTPDMDKAWDVLDAEELAAYYRERGIRW
jgi:hypothetical protein